METSQTIPYLSQSRTLFILPIRDGNINIYAEWVIPNRTFYTSYKGWKPVLAAVSSL